MKTKQNGLVGLLLGVMASVLNGFAGTLPANYTAVEYLESTGSQYLDTGYIHNANTKVVCDFSARTKQIGTWAAVFGSRNASYKASAMNFFAVSSKPGTVYNRTGAENTGTSIPMDTRVEVTCEGLVANWKQVEDPTVTGTITTTGTADSGLHSLFVFGLNQATVALGKSAETSSLCSMKLYSFKIYEGETLLHDLVPCISSRGVAGAYDLVAEKFLENLGTGRFFVPNEPDLFFAGGWVASGSSQWINTGYVPTVATRIETHVHPFARTGSWTSIFGVMKGDNSTYGVLVRFYNAENSLNGFFCNATYGQAKLAITPDTDLDLVLQASGLTINGTTAAITRANEPYQSQLYLFCENNDGAARRWQNTRFYDFKISENGVMKRNYLPARTASNQTSFCDLVEGKHYVGETAQALNLGMGNYSYSALADGTLTVHEGKLTASDLTGITTLVKAGPLALDVSSVAAMPATVTVNGGVLSFQNEVATAHTAGALSLAGCKRVEVDLVGTSMDTLTANSLTLPESGTIVLAVSGTITEPTTIAVLTAPGLDASRFTIDASGVLGGSARIVAGAENTLAVQLANDTMPYTYKGTTTDTLWGGAALVWQDNLGATVAWANGADTVFDSTGAAGTAVNDSITAGAITFNRNTDFTLTGTGTVGGNGTITKNGTGTLTLDGANFDQQSFVINAGKVVLGENAGTYSLGGDSGSGAGSVTINNGGQFNLNYLGAVGAADARQEITQLKTFKIAGDGADHRGALINDALDGREVHNEKWSSSFRRIELTDNATIGGLDRVDVRVRTGTAATATPGIYGPGKELTIKNSGYFGLISQPIDVQSVKITDGGVFRPEVLTEAQVKIPGGITLDNGTLHAYGNTTYPASMALNVTANGGEVSGQTGTTTFKGPVTVAEGGTLRLTQTASSTMNYQGGVTNNGVVTATSGTHNFIAGKLEGDGVWNIDGANLFWYGAFNLGKPRTVNLSNGIFFYGKETDDVAPLSHKVTVNATGGKVAFNIGKACTLSSDNVEIVGQPAGIEFLSRNDTTTYITLENFTASASSQLIFGGGSNGRYYLGEGVNLTGKEFYLNGNGKIADVYVREGASITSGTFAKIGNSNATTSKIVIDGGEFKTTGKNWIWMGPNANTNNFIVNAGSVTTYGILCRAAWKDPGSFYDQFTLNGGTLNLDGDAIRGWTRFEHFAEFNNGTVNSLNDWHVEQMRAVGFGGRAGGHVDFQLNDKTVNWATGLAGAADVTLKGSGTFKSGVGEKSSNLFLQGVLTGKWTVENTGNNDLSGASAFAGGLELATNVNASVRIGGSGLVDAVYLQTTATAINLGDSLKRPYPYACNDLKTMHVYEASATYDKGQFMWQGLFYADTAGTWTFAGSYDDAIYFEVDGAAVIATYTNFSSIKTGQVELTQGWHEFRLVQFQNTGGWGSPVAGWKNVMNFGFAKTATTSTAAADYQRFDHHNLPMKPGPGAAPTRDNLVNWSSVKNYNASTWKTRTDLTPNGTFKLSTLNTYNVAVTPTFAGSTHQFDGWFYVNGKQAGDWSVNVNYDDQGDLWIDGVDTGANGAAAKATVVTVAGVTPGWHQFVLRVADNAGNWGPWSNAGTCVSVTVNGTTYKFDENSFVFSATPPIERAGLDGVTTLNPGSTLTNTQTVDACPIWGTLAGTGTLNGKFAFSGDANCWAVTGAGSKRVLDAVKFEGSDATALAGLRKVKVAFAERPSNSLYEVGAALGADPALIALDIKDAKGNDYTGNFRARIDGTKLVLVNACPTGTMVFIR